MEAALCDPQHAGSSAFKPEDFILVDPQPDSYVVPGKNEVLKAAKGMRPYTPTDDWDSIAALKPKACVLVYDAVGGSGGFLLHLWLRELGLPSQVMNALTMERIVRADPALIRSKQEKYEEQRRAFRIKYEQSYEQNGRMRRTARFRNKQMRCVHS